MKRLLVVIAAVSMMSCSTSKVSRNPSSVGADLSGTRLGHANYNLFHDGPNFPAVRIYMNRAENEPGVYHVVLLEYMSIPGIAPQYLASRKLPVANKLIGYLKHITKKITVYKAFPRSGASFYELYPMQVIDKSIEVDTRAKPLILTLSSERSTVDPLAGASIVSVDGKVNISFPRTKADASGLQYEMAQVTYQTAKLDSTWRMNFLAGPYLAAYGKLDDVVLKLSANGTENTATFIDNQNLFKVSKKKRESIFTNPKSAFLTGTYGVNEPVDGMFVFWPNAEGGVGTEHVVGRIGLFIDIFDATKSLNQDVVELALINPGDPEDFLMYYEHPENGEGGR